MGICLLRSSVDASYKLLLSILVSWGKHLGALKKNHQLSIWWNLVRTGHIVGYPSWSLFVPKNILLRVCCSPKQNRLWVKILSPVRFAHVKYSFQCQSSNHWQSRIKNVLFSAMTKRHKNAMAQSRSISHTSWASLTKKNKPPTTIPNSNPSHLDGWT